MLPQKRGSSQDGASACQDLGRRQPALPERHNQRCWGLGLVSSLGEALPERVTRRSDCLGRERRERERESERGRERGRLRGRERDRDRERERETARERERESKKSYFGLQTHSCIVALPPPPGLYFICHCTDHSSQPIQSEPLNT